MNMENAKQIYKSHQVFNPINPVQTKTISGRTSQLSNVFSTEPAGPNHVLLTIIDQILLLNDQSPLNSNPIMAVELSFDLKFEVLYHAEKNVTTALVGIKFFKHQEEGQSFYCLQECVLHEWVNFLTKKLNRYGFEQMFKSHKKLGKGNSASVYEVERKTDGARFACKGFCKETSFSKKHGKQGLINELNIMRTLSQEEYTNILHLEGVYETKESIYVIVELFEGGQLSKLIKSHRSRPFSTQDSRAIMFGILKGLSRLHAHRYMHRDIKPENIMMKSDGLTPVISDFGLATHADQAPYLFFRCGTPGFVAPEIIRLTENKHIQPECDVFSAGVIFHILLTGEPLFEGCHFPELYKNNKELNFCLSGYIYDEVDPFAMDLLTKMLKIDHNQRITAQEALEHNFFEDAGANCTLKEAISPCLTADSYQYQEEFML